MTKEKSTRLTLQKRDPEEYRQTAELQRAKAARIADQLRRGESVTEGDRLFAAQILLTWAANLGDSVPAEDQQNTRREFDHEEAALAYAHSRQQGRSNAEALIDVSLLLDVQENSVRRAIEPLSLIHI